jgi:L-serine dehydratase
MKNGFKDFTAKEFLKNNENKDLYELFLDYETSLTKQSKEKIHETLKIRLRVMENAIKRKLKEESITMGKMGGDISNKLSKKFLDNKLNWALGELSRKAALYALATNEENACMGCIVACPTAGGAGVVPGVFFSSKEQFKFSNKDLEKGLFIASGIGAMIANQTGLSGAEGGCQAEVGSAVAMAGAGLTYMRGGTNEECFTAASLGLKNLLGLVCDPIGGLVEVPCMKRNSFGTQFSLLASDMALAGVKSTIPFDEVVLAMKEIGHLMHTNLKETAKGGLANTPTGKKIAKDLNIEI